MHKVSGESSRIEKTIIIKAVVSTIEMVKYAHGSKQSKSDHLLVATKIDAILKIVCTSAAQNDGR